MAKPTDHELRIVRQKKEELAQASKSLAKDKLAQMENEILQECFDIIRPALAFSRINPADGEGGAVPDEWRSLPIAEQQRMMRIAIAAWAPTKDTPFGVKVAFDTMQGIINARAKTESGSKVLNIESAVFTSPVPTFEILDLDE